MLHRSLMVGLIALASTGSAVFADVLLEHHNASLTTYVPSNSTSVQDVRPLVMQRGVGIDGSLRTGSTYGVAMSANPFGGGWTNAASISGVNVSTGTYAINDVDLSFPATVPWVIGRSYNARQKTSGGSYYASGGYQGNNWFQSSQPELVFHDSGTDSEDMIYLVYGADRYIEFRRADDAGTGDSSDTFRATNGAAGAIKIDVFPFTPDIATYTSQNGQQMVFFWHGDGDTDDDVEGQIWKIVNPGGEVAYVGHETVAATAISSGYNTTTGAITTAYDSEGRRFTYTYDGSTGKLLEVDAEINSGSWTSIGEVAYAYYVNADDDGVDGDLKTVTLTIPLSDDESTRTKYYRYYEDAYDASTHPGYPSLIQYVYDFEGTRAYDWAGDATFDGDYLTATTADLKPYAAAYFGYDTDRRITETWSNGQCGCAGGVASSVHGFTYSSNGSFSGTAGYDTAWYERVVVELPAFKNKALDEREAWKTFQWDETGQALTQVHTDDAPAGSGYQTWVNHAIRDSEGRVSSFYTPASVSSYTYSTGAVALNASAGLVSWIERVSSGDLTGLPEIRKSSTGSAGTKYLEGTTTFTSTTFAAGDMTVVRPFAASSRRYTQAITSGTTGSELTSMAYTYHSGGTAALAIKSIVTTHPAVSTSKNGSGVSDTTARYMRADGTVAFTRAEDDIYNYMRYQGRQLVESIQDVDLSQAFASGDDPNTDFGITENSDGWNRVSTMTYDVQGRPATSTAANGRVSATHYERLADQRLVTISYPKYVSGTSTYYGPASFQVANQAGKAEASGIVAISGGTSTLAIASHVDQTESDPILAIDVGPLGSMSTMHYDESGGVLQEQRVYFEIPDPPTAGPGVDGTNYDATFIEFNDAGQRSRTLAPHGTINRVAYDTLGRPIEQWIGTNDADWDEGSTTGTDNMVRTSLTEFDSGNEGGNSYATKMTRYVQDSDTDKRETSYAHDVKGRVLLTTNPTAPHALAKYDHMGRQTAVSMYSTAPASTADPTSTTSNRLAMSQMFYDERGRTWKSQRHNIDAADGSDDDELESLTWYDAVGRTIKVDGEQLVKTAYDRLGRHTHSFVLAVDDDIAYANADDVSGDVVLEESQTIYESSDSDDVVMRGAISRFHDDYNTGLTTGALDTNADANALKFTAAEIEGRIQITAMWYDDLDRMESSVHYGTNGGATYDRAPLTMPPTRSDTELRTDYAYDDTGRQYETTDPKGIANRVEFDDAGRETATIANYVDGTPSGDTDHYVWMTYADGLQTEYWVDFDGDGTVDDDGAGGNEDDQVTEYTYGTTRGASAGDSKIATGHLLYKIAYPDSTGASDTVTHAYNAQSQQIYKKDQAGTVLEYDFDDSGRGTATRASTIATGIDTRVQRIAQVHDDLGRLEIVSQYDAATAGNILDQVKYTYDGWGNVTKFEQDHDSAIGGALLYDVDYTYAKSTTGRNTIRRTGMELPNGDDVAYVYLSGIKEYDSEASRVTRITLDTGSGATAVVKYDYLGVENVVSMTYPEVDVIRHLGVATSGEYARLDRFDRIVQDVWEKDLVTDRAFYDAQVAYDRVSGIVQLVDEVHAGFDAIVSNDNLNRVTEYQQGTLSGAAIIDQTRRESWTLGQTGNWDNYELDEDGDGALERDEVRSHSLSNEIKDRNTDGVGAVEHSLAHTAFGAVDDDGAGTEYIYDAFGRLTEIRESASPNATIAAYKYNSVGYRVSAHVDANDDGQVNSSDLVQRDVYDIEWRRVAVYRGGETDAKAQWVHHDAGLSGRSSWSYIDEVVLRDRDASSAWGLGSDGVLDERLYYAQNWRFDVVAVIDAGGGQVEQSRVSPYGSEFGLPAGDSDSDGDVDSADVNAALLGVYDVRIDIDLDDDVDASDYAAVSAASGQTLGLQSRSLRAREHGQSGLRMGASGLVEARNRVFSIALGRFISPDPMEYLDGPNRFQFSASRPLNTVDPFGLTSGMLPYLLEGDPVDEILKTSEFRRGSHGYRHYLEVEVEPGNSYFNIELTSKVEARELPHRYTGGGTRMKVIFSQTFNYNIAIDCRRTAPWRTLPDPSTPFLIGVHKRPMGWVGNHGFEIATGVSISDRPSPPVTNLTLNADQDEELEHFANGTMQWELEVYSDFEWDRWGSPVTVTPSIGVNIYGVDVGVEFEIQTRPEQNDTDLSRQYRQGWWWGCYTP